MKKKEKKNQKKNLADLTLKHLVIKSLDNGLTIRDRHKIE
jgi:hypothetical protein